MLSKRFARKEFVFGIVEVDIDIAATARVVGILLRETRGVAVLPKHVDAIDLEVQGVRSRPDEAAHAAVTNRLAFFAPFGGGSIVEIGT